MLVALRCCGLMGRGVLRCSSSCSVPLRFIFALLCLMSCGLVVMLASALLANLLYDCLLPVLMGFTDTVVGVSALVGVSLFGCILITESAVSVISVAATAVKYSAFLSWARKGWVSKMALIQEAERRRQEQGQQQEPKDDEARQVRLKLLAEWSFEESSYQYAAMFAMDAIIACTLLLCILTSLLLSIWWPVDAGPTTPTFPGRDPAPPDKLPALTVWTYFRNFWWIAVLCTTMVAFFGLLFVMLLRSVYTLVRNALYIWSHLHSELSRGGVAGGEGAAAAPGGILARTCAVSAAFVLLAPLLLVSLPLVVLCLRLGRRLPGPLGSLCAGGLDKLIALGFLLPLPNLRALGKLDAGVPPPSSEPRTPVGPAASEHLGLAMPRSTSKWLARLTRPNPLMGTRSAAHISAEPQMVTGFAAVRLGVSVMLSNTSNSRRRTWAAFTHSLRGLNVWYMWLWFFVAYYMNPVFADYSMYIAAVAVVATLGVLATVNWRERAARLAKVWAHLCRGDELEAKAEAEARPESAAAGPPPPPPALSSSSSPESAGPMASPYLHVSDAMDSVDLSCAWGSLVMGLCYIFSFIGFGVSVPTGLIMLLCSVFLSGHQCLKRPALGLAAHVAKFLLAMLVAIFISFYSSTDEFLKTKPSRSSFALSNSWLPGPVPLGNVTPGSPGLAPLPTAYDLCPLPISGASLLDHCYLAFAVYEDEDLFVSDVKSWFSAANRNVTVLPRLPLQSSLVYNTFVEAASSRADNVTHVYIAFKGSSSSRDVSMNGIMFMETAIFQFMGLTMGPYEGFPVAAKQSIIGLMGIAGHQLSLSNSLDYTNDLALVAAQAAAVDPAAKISVAGHSLGGALATVAGQLFGFTAVGFSAPGILLNAVKLGLKPPRTRNYGLFNVAPDYDFIPLVDVQVGTVQHIGCLNTESVSKCHSVERSCCELRRQCGDPYGRTLVACANPGISRPN